MTQHDHREFVPGCYRCDLGRDEVEAAERRDRELVMGVFNRRIDHPDDPINLTEDEADAILRRGSVPRGQDQPTIQH